MDIAVIGGGAAGFFAAISCKAHHPHAQVMLYEKSGKLLSKVKVSGGGRCNVTNACPNNTQFAKHYPRGEKLLKKAFQIFNAADTIKWFGKRGVKLIAEADNRMFPESNDAQTIVDCLIQEAKKTKVSIFLRTPVLEMKKVNEKFHLLLQDQSVIKVDKVVVASGGSPKQEGLQWLEALDHTVVPPIPSLFTFNMPNETVKSLMGIVVDPVTVKVQSTKLVAEGPLLITHWGMSGPAVLKLSAWGARELYKRDYRFKIQINWLGTTKENQLREDFAAVLDSIKKRKISNNNPFHLPSRFWNFILEKAAVNPELIWGEISKKSLNKLINILLNDVYEVSGKTTFKEEFVTCGGISLGDITANTMESTKCPGLFFAGEVLDIDGITGGFNFQAAWTTGFIAGKLGCS